MPRVLSPPPSFLLLAVGKVWTQRTHCDHGPPRDSATPISQSADPVSCLLQWTTFFPTFWLMCDMSKRHPLSCSLHWHLFHLLSSASCGNLSKTHLKFAQAIPVLGREKWDFVPLFKFEWSQLFQTLYINQELHHYLTKLWYSEFI